MNVFDVISKHVDWASQRFSVASANVANLDTPGYRAKEVSEFELEMERANLQLQRTHTGHLNMSGNTSSSFEIRDQSTLEETHSSNNVSVENEMRTIGEAARAVSTDTALYKLFHRMTLAVAKG